MRSLPVITFLWRRSMRRGNGPSPKDSRNLFSNRVQLNLECLETRTLLSANVTPFHILYQPSSGVSPMSGPGPSGYVPSQISKAYGFNQLSFTSNGKTVSADGTGQTIAIVDAYNDPNITTDLQAFDKQFNLPTANFSVVNQNNGSVLPGNAGSSGWSLEESLDVEWAHAIAPGANIVLIEANSDNWSDLLTAIQTATSLPGVSVVSMSWGGSEWSGETSYDSNFTTPAGHNGIVFVAATGDYGAPPAYPSTSPNVLAVGGTTLTLDSSNNYQSESAWSGSTGGISADESLPSYQPSTYSNGTTTGTSTMRMNPDVAYDANPGSGFAVYDSYDYGPANPWVQLGGTSAGAPQWSAMIAITDQGRALAGQGTLDGPSQLLPMLYKMPSDFHDITSGTTTGSPSYSAGTGYDLTTGLGSPIANYLVPDLVYGAAPATPTGLTAKAVSTSQINLSWNSDTDARSYTLERSLDGTTWQVLTTTSGTTYSDTGLQAGTTYYYRIQATNGLGSSVYSASVNAITVAAVTNQFSDPGFETPNVGTGSWHDFVYNPSGAQWTYSSSSGVAGNGSGFTNGNPAAPQGTQVAFLQKYGTMSQVVNFSAGTYAISFYAAQRYGQASSQKFEVTVDGTVVGTFTPTSTTYSVYTTNSFTVTAGTHTIEFIGLNPSGGDNTAFVDEASIQQPATNQFNDPGFETPNVGTGSWHDFVYNPSGAPWTYSSSSGVAGNGSGFTNGNPNAPQGTQVAFLQKYGTMSQVVNFSAGTYAINFYAAQRYGQASSQTFEVTVDGTVVGTFTPTSTTYGLYTTNSFTVTAGTHTVEFIGLDPNGGDNTALIDDASI